jgi:uncharacterized protein
MSNRLMVDLGSQRRVDKDSGMIAWHSGDMGGQKSDEISVVDNAEKSRFELTVDGRLVGRLDYALRARGAVALTHTEVDEAFQGRGLAGRLVRAALDSARGRGLTVIPTCPYVVDYIRRHPDDMGLVDVRHRGRFDS